MIQTSYVCMFVCPCYISLSHNSSLFSSYVDTREIELLEGKDQIWRWVVWIPYKWNNFPEKKHLHQTLNKLCVIKTHILKYQNARCDHKLWNALWFYCIFFRFFIHIIDDYSCLKNYIFTKLLQIVCLIHTHILACEFANETVGYGRFSD